MGARGVDGVHTGVVAAGRALVVDVRGQSAHDVRRGERIAEDSEFVTRSGGR